MTSKIPLSVVPHPPKNSKPVSSKYPHSASPLNELYVGSRTPTSGDIGNLRRRRLRPARASSNTTNDSPVSSATRSPVIEEVIGLDSRSAISVSRLPNDSFLQREATSAESTSSRHGRPPRPAATNLPPSMQRTPEPPSNPPNRTVSADLEKLRARSGSLSGRSERQFSARSQLRGFLVESPRYRDGASENGNLPSIARRDSIKSETLNDSYALFLDLYFFGPFYGNMLYVCWSLFLQLLEDFFDEQIQQELRALNRSHPHQPNSRCVRTHCQ